MFYEPKKGHPFKADPFNALVFPRPIGWISSSSKKGIANLAPYSFFNAIAMPPHNKGQLPCKKTLIKDMSGLE